jgi:hypothetical protein
MTVFIEKVSRAFHNFDLALTRDLVDPYTVKINAADRMRDLRFLGFKNYVEACSYRKQEGWQEAAVQIKAAIERYGNDLYRLSLPEETAALQNLMSDLEQEPLKAACDVIQLLPWIEELNLAQTHFEALRQQQNSQDHSVNKTLLETRKPLNRAVKNLLKMIELQQVVQESDAFNAMVNQIDNLIATSMSSARLSRSLSDRIDIEG